MNIVKLEYVINKGFSYNYAMRIRIKKFQDFTDHMM